MNLSEKDLKDITELLKREPTKVEKHIFDVMWSEHCSYKSSKAILKKYIPQKGNDVLVGIGEDAGVVKFIEHDGKKYAITIGHESHNHPSQVLPIEGAATGVGGIVRDVYCMGADVIGVLDSLHFGRDKSGKNMLVDEIAEEVVLGVSDYANPLGVPVLGGETLYHSSYNDNCLVNVGALGILEERHIIRSRVPDKAKTVPYDVILIGKSTDCTGFGGASFASATLDKEDDTTNIGAVQVHDPFLKRVLVEATKFMFKEVARLGIEIGFKDLGAGGIACATSEIAAANNMGVNIYLDKVNVSIDNLAPEIIACSETQERYCLVVPKEYSEHILNIYNNIFELPQIYHKAGAVVVGQVVTDPFYTQYYKGEKVCNLPIHAITTEVKAERHGKAREIIRHSATPNPAKIKWEEVFQKIMSLPNICSRRYIYRFYDNAVRGDTVMYPGEADSVVITPIQNCPTAVTVNMSSNLYGKFDPYMCGAYAVAEALRNIICVGGEPIAMTDCLNYGNPEKPDVFFDFEEGVKGLSHAAWAFSFNKIEPIPIVSGNVSFYNESKLGNAIIPSPVIMILGRVADYHLSRSMAIKNSGSHLILVGERLTQFGGTQIAELVPSLNNIAPQVNFETEAKANKTVYQLIQDGRIDTCHDISMGGLFVTLCEMFLGERGHPKFGTKINISEKNDLLTFLFSENGGYVLEVSSQNLDVVINTLEKNNIYYYNLGTTAPEPFLKIDDLEKIAINDLAKAWNIKNEN